MATQCSSDCSDSINQQPSVISQLEEHTPQPDYDFVDQPDQDHFCPVSLELLTQPHQTDCCGHHISEQVANKLVIEKKPCPICTKESFITHYDLYFKRNSINKLKIYCSYKKNECKWTGELGDLDQHTIFCSKRPWQCPHCEYQSTHDIGPTNHITLCNYQPVPCPNNCQVETVPRCHVEKHLLTCPLQLVDCEFASVGCDVRVPRKKLADHMTESAQHHLMTATLLNLELTKDLHKNIKERDEQINQLDTKVNTKFQQLDKKIDTKFQKIDAKFQKIDTKLQQLHTKVDAKQQQLEKQTNTNFQKIDTKLQQLQIKIEAVETKVQQLHENNNAMLQELDTKAFQKVNTILQQLDANVKTTTNEPLIQAKANNVGLYNDPLLHGFTCHNITLTKLTDCQMTGEARIWESISIGSNTPKEHSFVLAVHNNATTEARGTHLSVFLGKKHNKSKTEGVAIFHLLNQLADHGHYIGTEEKFSKTDEGIWLGEKFLHLEDLNYRADSKTQYLKDNCLKFRLFLKVNTLSH